MVGHRLRGENVSDLPTSLKFTLIVCAVTSTHTHSNHNSHTWPSLEISSLKCKTGPHSFYLVRYILPKSAFTVTGHGGPPLNSATVQQQQFLMCPAVAYEMLVSHSPPVFSHSPPTGFLSEYPPFRPDPFKSRCRPLPPLRSPIKVEASPKRPCLVIRPEEASVAAEEAPTSPTSRLKKRVVFADDRGMSLTHVRVMTEPSNVPPLWSFRFLAEVTQGLTAEPEARLEPWEVAFSQPASDYVDFRRRLETAKVSLENVIVKEAEDLVLGTVKVSNLSYQKEVFVRHSSDGWGSFEDAFCNYVPAAAPSAAYVLFDTFSFKVPLRPRARRVEFCVGFRCEGSEFWDNNDGKNYIIVKKVRGGGGLAETKEPVHQVKAVARCADAAQAKLDSWSEFASWTHLENSSPYW